MISNLNYIMAVNYQRFSDETSSSEDMNQNNKLYRFLVMGEGYYVKCRGRNFYYRHFGIKDYKSQVYMTLERAMIYASLCWPSMKATVYHKCKNNETKIVSYKYNKKRSIIKVTYYIDKI